MQTFLNLLPLGFSTLQIYEWIYFVLFIASAVAIYLVMVARIGEEFPRRTIDTIFFLMIGVASVIWVLSKVATPATV